MKEDEWDNDDCDGVVGCDGVCGSWFHYECLETHMGIQLSEDEAQLAQYWYCPSEACQTKKKENEEVQVERQVQLEGIVGQEEKKNDTPVRRPVQLKMHRLSYKDNNSTALRVSNRKRKGPAPRS